MKISASVLATKITKLETLLPNLDPASIDYLHMDVMDGNYVPQISFGEAIVKEISETSSIPLDIHLMVRSPESHVSKYYPLKPAYLTFHIETTDFSVRLTDEIRKNGSKVGVSLNPQTPLDRVRHILDHIDLILIMTVDPGFYGQKFFTGGLDKIREAKKLIGNRPISIEVDGGVNSSNYHDLFRAGVDITVVGAALFSEGNPNQSGKSLKQICIDDSYPSKK